jgi:hypothetical protein
MGGIVRHPASWVAKRSTEYGRRFIIEPFETIVAHGPPAPPVDVHLQHSACAATIKAVVVDDAGTNEVTVVRVTVIGTKLHLHVVLMLRLHVVEQFRRDALAYTLWTSYTVLRLLD